MNQSEYFNALKFCSNFLPNIKLKYTTNAVKKNKQITPKLYHMSFMITYQQNNSIVAGLKSQT